MTPSRRTLARETVLQTLYACEHGELEPQQAFESIAEIEQFDEYDLEFAKTLLSRVVAHSGEADEHISRLAQNWVLERIAAIDRSILRMAIIELTYIPDTPVKVVINEAIELAKRFSTVESSKFVNGILDSFIKSRDAQSAS
ncbi:MAG: transcription antitermination factor NusB [Candidatus Zixiibacteriota bacterium]|nr:MAG: transcription antitermination factor NusB [candidate division Zixibacteria bacterium]